MNFRPTALGVMLAVLLTPAHAVIVDAGLPRYESREIAPPKNASYVTPTGAITVVGYNDMTEMLTALGARFGELHPGFAFAWDLPGTKAAPAALAAGKSAFAPMGAEMTPPQLADYEKITHAPPLVFRLAHASLNPRALSGSLAIFVHKDNPRTMITLAELTEIFSGADAVANWQPCGVEGDAALGLFFRERVRMGQAFAKNFAGFPQSAEVVKRVGEDVRAIGFAAAMRATPAVKILALATRAGDTPVALTEENLEAGRYPLDRHLLICVRPPIEPWLREFLRFALSRDGQELVAAGTLGYLPLNAHDATEELAGLR